MPYLIIETSTDRGVIACLADQEIIFIKLLSCGQNQSKQLMPELDACLKASGVLFSELDYIGVGVGPGSYTGIRIGVAVAQTLAYSWQLPLIGVPSLNGFVPKEYQGDFTAIIDARIGGAYLRRGLRTETGIVFSSEPQVCLLEELGDSLPPETYLVTPNALSLKPKLEKLFPAREWQWEERFPCISSLAQSVRTSFAQDGGKGRGN